MKPITASGVRFGLDDIEHLTDRDLMILVMAVEYERRQRRKSPMPSDRWDPWAVALRSPTVRFGWRRLPDGMGGLTDHQLSTGRYAVILDPRLGSDERELAEVLTHELIHVERGVDHWTDEEREVEEATVRALTAARMARWVDPRRSALARALVPA